MDGTFVRNTKAVVEELVTKRDRADQIVCATTQYLNSEVEKKNTAIAARAIVQEISKAVQQQVHSKISGIVNKCLSSVFDDPYEFRITFDTKRGRTGATMEFVRDGIVLDDPLNQVGGGVIDVASLALRLACILLTKPRRRKLLVLDEPLKNVRGRDNRKKVKAMLEALTNELGVQVIINVDLDSYPEFALGKIVELS